jgi:hypothetical protein
VKRKKQNNLLGDELQRTGASCKNVMDMIWYSTVHVAPDASMLRVRGGWGGCERAVEFLDGNPARLVCRS